VWMGVTVFLLTAVVLVAFSPRALAENRDPEKQQMLDSFGKILDFVQSNYVDADKVETKALVEGALKGLFQALGDQYSEYLAGEDLRALEDTTTGEFSGIGVVISKEADAAGAEVVSPLEGTPAYRAGVTAGDVFLKINGEELQKLSLEDIVDRIRGPEGEELTLTIQRGKSLVFDVTLRRATVQVPTVKRAMMPGGIGYLRITTFTPFTARNVEEAIRYFGSSSYRALIVDVRSNGGGRLDSVIQIADYFLDSGTIVSTRGRSRAESHTYAAHLSDTIVSASIPVVVLIDAYSASASEILAGALKDTGRAKTIGQKSFGKGTVQQMPQIGDFVFKLTMSKYYTPSGISIDGTGIEPDIPVPTDELSEAELASYDRLVKEGRLRSFVEGSRVPGAPAESEIVAFLDGIQKDGIVIGERLARKLIRDEANRTNNSPPVYDLEYDRVLQRAVEVLGQQVTKTAAQ
jgi:carboxyl-terminal processing protease